MIILRKQSYLLNQPCFVCILVFTKDKYNAEGNYCSLVFCMKCQRGCYDIVLWKVGYNMSNQVCKFDLTKLVDNGLNFVSDLAASKGILLSLGSLRRYYEPY